MADDKLIFPIGFDLEAAVKNAGDDWDKKYADRLEKLIAKRSVNVKLQLDTSKLDSLDAVKKRLAELKIEPITPETKTAIKELARELQTLAKALEQVQKYSTGRAAASPDAVRAARINEINTRSEAKAAVEREKARAAAARAEQAELRLAQARTRAAAAATRSAEATRNANREYHNQDGYISRLIKRLAVYAGFSAIGTFLSRVREVTAEFELQRVSLGAIIQDQQRANQLFSEIKAFALQSPVSILDLTKYTKQLAAYKIGVDELFETTKKLTDVSVGLGVSMERIVLFYGQVRAKGWLTAQDLKQATEAGIPLTEELAKKLSAVNGELVTAGQVMDMISKRQISFEQVKEVFDDMTSAGGMFYNMQEKQGNTLYGMWAKLGDAASVMYEQIGNTESVNAGMKAMIRETTDLFKHWRFWGKLIMWSGGLYLTNAIAMKALRAATVSYTAAGIKNAAAMKANVTAAEEMVAKTKTAGRWTQWSARLTLSHARAQYQAATATNVFSKSLYSLKAAFLSNPLGMVIMGVTALVALFADADDSAKQFAQSLSEIEEKYTLKSLNDASNFKRLANAALNAAEGSKEQREKLEELDRTYGKIVGSENLRIDKLREMNGEYGSLIDTIDEYNTKMKYQEREGAIKEYYGGKKKGSFGDLEEELSTLGFGDKEIGREAGAAIAINLQNALLEEIEKNGRATMETARKVLKEQIVNVFKARGMGEEEAEQWTDNIIGRLSSINIWWGQSSEELNKFIDSLNEERAAIEANAEEAEKAGGKLAQVYADIKQAKAELDKIQYVDSAGKQLDTNTFFSQQSVINETMKKAADVIRNSQEMKDALGDKAKELEPMWLHLVDSVSPDDLMDITTINFDALLKILDGKYPELKSRIEKVREEWGNIAPTNETALQIRQKLADLSMSFDPTLKKMKRFLWDGSGDVDDYLKRLKEQQEELKKRLKEKQTTLQQASLLSKWWNKLQGKDISAEIEQMNKEIAALDELIPYVQEYTIPKEKNKGGRTSDPRLQNLKEEISLVQKLYQEYKQLEKQEGAAKAAADMEKLAGESIKALSGKYGIALPTTAKDLTSALEILYKKMAKLPRKVFPALDKDLRELRWTIEKVNIDDAQKKIEEQLKTLSDRISRTKTAREFYDRILAQTGDVEMAGTLTMNVYGEGGEDLFNNTVSLLQEYFSGVEVELPINFATQQIDYTALRKIWEADKALPKEMRKIPEAYDSAIKQMLDSADSANQKMIEGWLKATEKAKTYSDKLLDLARTTQNELSRIDKERSKAQIELGNLLAVEAPTAEQNKRIEHLRDMLEVYDELRERFNEKQSKEQASLAYEAFKDSPMYVQMFDNLDNASTRMLENMRTRLIALRGEWKNLDPTQLKEMQSRLNEIDAQLAKRNPFKTLAKSISDYQKLSKNGSKESADDALVRAEERRAQAEAMLKEAAPDSEDAKFWQQEYDAAEAAAHDAEKVVENWKKVEEAIKLSGNELSQMLNWAGDIAKAVADISEVLGADEEDVQYWNTVADSLGQIAGGIQDIVSAAMSGNVVGIVSSVLTAIPKMFVGFVNLFNAGKIRDANKEIKKQAELLERLEYTYSRLEKEAEKVFGTEYIANYNRQLKILNAQAEAYRKQAAAERDKGKKADKEKIKEYENAARDAMNNIADMQGQLAEKFLGTSLTSAARDFARAWLDAYKEFGNTADKMSEKFREMIENMVVESLLARSIQRALEPAFTMIDEMREGDFYNPTFWQKVMDSADRGAKAADAGAKVIMEWAKDSFGYDPRGTADEFTGIKRDIASASEEQITGLAATMNTWSYYVSFVPGISADVAAIRQAIERGLTSPIAASTTGEWTDWQQQAMNSYLAIQRNTADTVVECRRAAVAAENAVTQLKRVITNNPSSTSYGVKVFA